MRYWFMILLMTLATALAAQQSPLSYGTKPVDFDGVQVPTEQPAVLLQPLELIYPEKAVALKLEGVSLVSAWIDAKGYVVYAVVTEGSGHGMLDSAALNAVVGGDFKAAKRDGKNVASRVTVPVEFRLRRMQDEYDAGKTPEELQKEKEELQRAKDMLEAEQRKLEEELRLLREQQNKKK